MNGKGENKMTYFVTIEGKYFKSGFGWVKFTIHDYEVADGIVSAVMEAVARLRIKRNERSLRIIHIDITEENNYLDCETL